MALQPQSSAVPDTAFDAMMDEEEWAAVIAAADMSNLPPVEAIEVSDAGPASPPREVEGVASTDDAAGELGEPRQHPQPLHPHIAAHGLEALPNFRDVASAAPEKVAAGRFFRGGTPANASPQDVDYLIKTLGIRTIIDLRSGEESAGDIGDRLIYHYFVDEDVTSKIVRRSKSELGDVFRRSTSVSRLSSLSRQRSSSGTVASPAERAAAKYREMKRAREKWEEVSDPIALRAEIYRLQGLLSSGGHNAESVEPLEQVSPADLNGFLIMLRPMSGKWKPTWCVLRGNDIEFYGTERERVREVRTTSQDTHVTKKASGKAVFAGKITLVPGVSCKWAADRESVDLAALGPGVEARGKVPPCTFKLLNAGGHTYYFTSSVVRPALLDVDAAQLEHEEEPTEVVNSRVVNHWYEVISQKLQSVAVNSVFGSDKPKVPRPILRFPFCDKKTMASVLIGMASARTRVSVVGGFLSGGKEKAKSILIKVFDEQGLFGLYKIILDHNQQQICRCMHAIADGENHPILLNCSHGKDRTGLITALVLRAIGCTSDEIAADYHISEAHGTTPEAKAIFRKHSPHLTLEKWTKAPVSVMIETLKYIDDKYQGIHSYLTHIGFDAGCQSRLRDVFKPQRASTGRKVICVEV